jgi:hypothetical protein
VFERYKSQYVSSPLKKKRLDTEQAVAALCLSGSLCAQFCKEGDVNNNSVEEIWIEEKFVISEKEVDGFKYVAGFTTRKFRSQYPHLIGMSIPSLITTGLTSSTKEASYE